MSYLTQARMAQDEALIMRIAACAATEGVRPNPVAWADDRRVIFMASPGWSAAYASASALRDGWDGEGVQPPPPGENEAAITDGMVLSAVQALRADELVSPPDNEK